MTWIKKFWITFASFLPFTAGAVAPFVLIGAAGVGVIAGFSIYRTMAPVNMTDALKFFSTCWTCDMFSDIMGTMSNLVPKVYSAIGGVMVPFAAALLAVWFAWRIVSGFFNSKLEKPWDIAASFGTQMIRLTVLGALLMMPLPRLITDVVITPVFNVGLYINQSIDRTDDFAKCVVATALADPNVASVQGASRGAFSPTLRHNLACQVANIHQMTGLGMTVGWTMLSMAFNDEYMHKILWDIPIFPNVPIFFAGLLILALFFSAMLPVPLYFLEIFVGLAIDLILLPLSLLAWMFGDWKVLKLGGNNIRKMIDDVIKATAGIAMVCIFLTFVTMFLNAVFGQWNGASRLATAIAQNDSTVLMDGLMMRNDSIVTVVMMGIFITMFMIMMKPLIESLFAQVKIPTKYYETAKKDVEIVWGNLKKWYAEIKK